MSTPRSYTAGQYAGINTPTLGLQGVLLSETHYKTGAASDWHFHENPYFALILNGGSKEIRKSGSIECLPGKVYFYDRDDAHLNKDYQPQSRNFNVEFDRRWLSDLGLAPIDIDNYAAGNLQLPLLQLLKEYKRNDAATPAASHFLVLEMLTNLTDVSKLRGSTPPVWAKQLRELLLDRWSENISLTELSRFTGTHPVTISKHFRRYFGCTLGEYMRRLKMARALPMLRASSRLLTTIAFDCGFADQSHFIRTCRELTGFSPRELRRL